MNKIVAVIAAHPDDEVLGCGGTLAKMTSEGYEVHILLMADGESSRVSETGEEVEPEKLTARNGAAEAACKILGCASVVILALPDNRLDEVALLDVVKCVEIFVQKHRPSVVFTHHRGDLNIDHCLVHDAVITACRPQRGSSVRELFFFEVPSSTEWKLPGSVEPFSPNLFIDISATLEIKLEALQAYRAELREFPHPRSLKAIEALAQWRGATVGCHAAEAFILGRKIVQE